MKKIYLLLAVSIFFYNLALGQSKSQRFVLFEEFTFASCGFCPACNSALKALVDANPTKVIELRYQGNQTEPGWDPMFDDNPSEVNNRSYYYNIGGVPTPVMDGTTDVWPSQSALNAEYAVPSPFTISLSHQMSGDHDSIYITVVINATANVTGNLKLQTAIIEKKISYIVPPGTNDETEFYHVMRKMIPNALGTALASSWQSGQTKTLNFNVPLPTYIRDMSQVGVIAFIQDNNTKNVKQAAYSAPQPLFLDAEITSLTNVPLMQCGNDFTPSFVLKNTGLATLTSATINYYIDTDVPSTYTWTGSLAPNGTDVVTLPLIIGAAGLHTFSVSINTINWFKDTNPWENTKKSTFYIVTSGAAPPITEHFSGIFPPSGWMVNNPDLDSTWVRKRYLGANNTTACARILFFDNYFGHIDDLMIKPVDLSGFTSATLTFYDAYAQYGTDNDRIQVQTSTDCGETWETKWDKQGAALATTATDTNTIIFIPTSSQWKLQTVDLSSVSGHSGVLVRFRSISGWGNIGYIDEVNITGSTGIESLNNSNKDLLIYPNPTDGIVTINNAENSTITVNNILGKQVIIINNAAKTNTIDLSGLPSGNYFVKVSNEKGTATKKIIMIK